MKKLILSFAVVALMIIPQFLSAETTTVDASSCVNYNLGLFKFTTGKVITTVYADNGDLVSSTSSSCGGFSWGWE